MKRAILFVLGVSFLVAIGCREPYRPDIISSSNSYLVVEGILDAGTGPTTLRLSRTFKLDDSARMRGEVGAQVIVEGKDNSVRLLTMAGEGLYTSSNLGLDLNQEYRLKIVTSNGKEYVSEWVVAKLTPPIDSLMFEQNSRGVQIYASTHDPTNNTRYYLWNFDETWEIRTYYYSLYVYENDIVRERLLSEDVSRCWKYDFSKTISVGSSASLQQDIISRAPIYFINNGDEKLAERYSILLHQFALDKQGYEFYEMMRKNTEGLGTIFDPQPSEIRGNIKCISDPDELVIGYVGAAVAQEKRFFIARRELNSWRFDQDCPADTIPNHADSIRQAYSFDYGIFSAIPAIGGGIAAYVTSRMPCIDCTRRGGSLARPSYW